jgi:hypothetical protein
MNPLHKLIYLVIFASLISSCSSTSSHGPMVRITSIPSGTAGSVKFNNHSPHMVGIELNGTSRMIHPAMNTTFGGLPALSTLRLSVLVSGDFKPQIQTTINTSAHGLNCDIR